MRILVDVDGVCADLMGHVLRSLSFPVALTEKDLKRRDQRRDLALSDFKTHGCGHDPGLQADMFQVFNEMTFDEIAGLDPHREIVRAIRSAACSHDVVFLTSPWDENRHWLEARKIWLGMHFHMPKIIFASSGEKKFVRGDILIEDNLDTLRSWMNANPLGCGILVDRPWNQDDVGPWFRYHEGAFSTLLNHVINRVRVRRGEYGESF